MLSHRPLALKVVVHHRFPGALPKPNKSVSVIGVPQNISGPMLGALVSR